MNMIVFVNVTGLLLIIAVIWWFWISKKTSHAVEATDITEIIVKDGVYTPGEIHAKLHQPVTLRFIRKDSAPCAEFVLFSDLNISKTLPIETPTDIKFTPEKTGEFHFTCQMGMYRGKIFVS